jgi:hypothetical protein
LGETGTGTNVWKDGRWEEKDLAAVVLEEGRLIYQGSIAFLSGNKVLLLWDRTIQEQSNISMSTLKWTDVFKNSSACR